MPIPSTTILSLDAQLSLLYAIALHYDTELSNLYHELFMTVIIAISLQWWRVHDEKVVSASYIPRIRGYIPSGRGRCVIISNK